MARRRLTIAFDPETGDFDFESEDEMDSNEVLALLGIGLRRWARRSRSQPG